MPPNGLFDGAAEVDVDHVVAGLHQQARSSGECFGRVAEELAGNGVVVVGHVQDLLLQLAGLHHVFVEHHLVHRVLTAERTSDAPHGQVGESRQSALDRGNIKAEVADLQWSHGLCTLPGRAHAGNGDPRMHDHRAITAAHRSDHP